MWAVLGLTYTHLSSAPFFQKTKRGLFLWPEKDRRMNRQDFINFNARNSTQKSGKAYSYAKAIEILDNVLQHQNVINLNGMSLYDVNDPIVIEEILNLVRDEEKKMKRGYQSIFDYGKSDQTSYPLGNFCSAALSNLMVYAQYEQDKAADEIVKQETNPKEISKKLILHYDITKEGKDEKSEAKRRRGQDYFRRMILNFYGGRCALTGINVEQLLLASHIIPWRDETHIKERLNPCNGICLSALYDKAFDKGLITISPDDFKVSLSSALLEYESEEYFDKHFACIDGQKITLPSEYQPDKDFLAYHRENVFMGR